MLDHNAEIQKNKVNDNIDTIKFLCYTKLISEQLVLKGYDLYIEIGTIIGLTEEQCRAKHQVEGGTFENYLKTKINFYFTELKLNGLVEPLGDAYWSMSDEGKQAKNALQLDRLLQRKKNKKLTTEQISEQYSIFCEAIWKPYHIKHHSNMNIGTKNAICGKISKDRAIIARHMINSDDMNVVLNGYYC